MSANQLLLVSAPSSVAPSFSPTSVMDSSYDNNNNYYNASLYSKHQYYLMTIAAWISCVLSLLGSLSIVVFSYRRCLFSIYQRLIFTISLFDVVTSSWLLLAPVLMPKYTRSFGIYFASGTMVTCSFSGFGMNLGMLMVSFYNFYLSLYFYLKVEYRVLDSTIQKRYQTPANIIAIATSLAISIGGLIVQGYKPRPYANVCVFGTCQIGVPGKCHGNLRWGDSVDIFFFISVLVVSILALSSTILTICVYLAVRKTLLASSKHEFHDNGNTTKSGSSSMAISPLSREHQSHVNQQAAEDDHTKLAMDLDNENSNNEAVTMPQPNIDVISSDTHHNTKLTMIKTLSKSIQHHHDNHKHQAHRNSQQQKRQQHNHLKHSRLLQVRNQTVMYSFVYLNTLLWLFVFQFIQAGVTNSDGTIEPGYMTLTVLAYFFYPLQGFLNFFVYTRPRYCEYRKLFPNESRWKCLYLSLTLESANSNKNYQRHHGRAVTSFAQSTNEKKETTREGFATETNSISKDATVGEPVNKSLSSHIDIQTTLDSRSPPSSSAVENNQEVLNRVGMEIDDIIDGSNADDNHPHLPISNATSSYSHFLETSDRYSGRLDFLMEVDM